MCLPVSFLPTHHDPHGSPLCQVDGLNHPRDLVHKADGPSDVVEHTDVPHLQSHTHKTRQNAAITLEVFVSSADLLPGHGHVLQQFEEGVRHVLEGAQVDALVVAVLAAGHVSVVADDLADVLRRHVLFLRVHEPELALLRIALGLE